MKYIIAILFFIISAENMYAQKKSKMTNDTLTWSAGYKLSIDDFEGRKHGRRAGESWTGIFFHTKESDGTIKFVVEAVFEKSKSFLRDSSKYVMMHEQGHFDITEINARRMRKKIAEKDFKKVKNISGVIKGFYERTNAEWAHEQDQYDNGTEHGMNPAKQDVWNDKIEAELKELDAFADREIDIRK